VSCYHREDAAALTKAQTCVSCRRGANHQEQPLTREHQPPLLATPSHRTRAMVAHPASFQSSSPIPSQVASREESPSAGCCYHNELVASMRDQSLWCQSTGSQPTMRLRTPRGSPIQGLHDHAVDSPRKPVSSSPSSSCSEVGHHRGAVIALRLLLPHSCRDPPMRPAAGTAHPRACEAVVGPGGATTCPMAGVWCCPHARSRGVSSTSPRTRPAPQPPDPTITMPDP
jgi:hypothetical protein